VGTHLGPASSSEEHILVIVGAALGIIILLRTSKPGLFKYPLDTDAGIAFIFM
jgi:hypothetical protein